MKKLTNTQTKILDAIFDWWDSGYDIDGNFVIYPEIEDEPVRDELEDWIDWSDTKWLKQKNPPRLWLVWEGFTS